MTTFDKNQCERSAVTCAYAAQALPDGAVAEAEAHIESCLDCRRELESLRPVVDSFVSWPTDVLRPTASLYERLAERIAAESGRPVSRAVSPEHSSGPGWKQVAPGIECKLLATDMQRHRVSMLVRLAPGASYPPHTHAGAEELHLLDGELWIDDRKLQAGDYNRAEAGTSDERVWSETGCTCLLLTSIKDRLR
jgi:hypothetical protein